MRRKNKCGCKSSLCTDVTGCNGGQWFCIYCVYSVFAGNRGDELQIFARWCQLHGAESSRYVIAGDDSEPDTWGDVHDLFESSELCWRLRCIVECECRAGFWATHCHKYFANLWHNCRRNFCNYHGHKFHIGSNCHHWW